MARIDNIRKLRITTEWDPELECIAARVSFRATVEPEEVRELLALQTQGALSVAISSAQLVLPLTISPEESRHSRDSLPIESGLERG